MGSFSIWHWIIVIGLVLVLFGRGKVSELMGDVAKGIKSFKKGMADEDEVVADKPRTLNRDSVQPLDVEPVETDRRV